MLKLGLGLGIGSARRSRSISFAPLSSVTNLGWSAIYPSPPAAFDPSSSPEYLSVTRSGYDGTGSVTTFDENVVVTARVREPYPDQDTLTTDTVSLSEPVFASDTLVDITNSSTLVAPKPVCVFSRPDHTLVGDTVDVAVCAFSGMPKGGEPVAAVVFSATDGTTTVTQTVTEMSVSDWGVADAGGKVLEYAASIDVSSLNDDVEITVDAKVYPHVGAQYADSSRNLDFNNMGEGSNRRWTTQRFYRKSTHVPIYAYVSTTGNDLTGMTSTTTAIAEASPFATIAAAVDAIQAADGSRVDGHVVRLMAGTHQEWGGATSSAVAQYSYLTIERGPAATRDTVILQPTADTDVLDVDYIKFTGITMQRVSDYQFNVPVGANRPIEATYASTWVHDCVVDNIGYTGTQRFFSTSFEGVWTQNLCQNIGDLFDTQKQLFTSLRGNDLEDTANGIEVSAFIGNRLQDCTPAIATDGPDVVRDDGSVIAFNQFLDCEYPILLSTALIEYGAAIIQNLFEVTGSTENRCIQWGAESTAPANTMNNIIVMHNTVAAQGDSGRVNLFYDDDPGNIHYFTNTYVRGNCFGQLNIKTDVFSATLNGANVGNWHARYGSGYSGNWTQSTEEFNQEFPGMSSDIPDGDYTYTGYDFTFENYQGVTYDGVSSPVAGAGGGDYHLSAGSRGEGGTPRYLTFDLEGYTRDATTNVGCYNSSTYSAYHESGYYEEGYYE